MKKYIVIFLMFFAQKAYSEDVCGKEAYQTYIKGKAYEISDYGIKTPFRSKLELEGTGISVTNFSNDGDFLINKTISKELNFCAGSKVKIKLDDPDLFVLSPFAGEFYLPNAATSSKDLLQIRIVKKYSRFYQTLALSTESYAIQVAATNNEGGAIDIINQLNNSDFLKTTDYFAYYEPHMRGGLLNNGYIYKVKVGSFSDKKQAELKLEGLIKMDRIFAESFITANVKFYQ